jgi:hypothetical protein
MLSAVVFLLAPLVFIAAGVRAMPFENRPLVGFPRVDSGWRFFSGLSGWATDRLPFRRLGVQAEDWISRTLFGELPPRGQQDTGSPIGPPTEHANQPSQAPYITQYATVLQGSAGWLYLGQDVSNKCVPVNTPDQVTSEVNQLRAAVESSGRRFVLVVAPDKSTMDPEHLPATFVGRDCWTRQSTAFWSRMDGVRGVLDMRPALRDAAASTGHPLYDGVDTHWSYQGGLVMTYALAETLTPGSTAPWQVTPTRTTGWPADIPPLLGEQAQRDLQNYSLAPDGHTDRTNYVGSDFRTPLRLSTPQGGPPVTGTIGEPVGMIADSFTQFASPFLAAAFDDLTIVHPETVAADPTGYAERLFTDRRVIVVELAERELAGGASPLLRPSVIAALGEVLHTHPIR